MLKCPSARHLISDCFSSAALVLALQGGGSGGCQTLWSWSAFRDEWVLNTLSKFRLVPRYCLLACIIEESLIRPETYRNNGHSQLTVINIVWTPEGWEKQNIRCWWVKLFSGSGVHSLLRGKQLNYLVVVHEQEETFVTPCTTTWFGKMCLFRNVFYSQTYISKYILSSAFSNLTSLATMILIIVMYKSIINYLLLFCVHIR